MDTFIKLRHPMIGLDIARVIKKDTNEKGEIRTFIDLGKFRCCMIGAFDHVEMSADDPEIQLFGQRMLRAHEPIVAIRQVEQRLIIDESGTASAAYCLCGCGKRVARAFLPGHDARLKSVLGKVMEGKSTIDDIPEGVREYVMANEKWRTRYGHIFA